MKNLNPKPIVSHKKNKSLCWTTQDFLFPSRNRRNWYKSPYVSCDFCIKKILYELDYNYLKTLNKYNLKYICNRLNISIRYHYLVSKQDFIKILLNHPIDVSSNIIDKFSKYHLFLKCDSLNLDYEDTFTKKKLKSIITNHLNLSLKNESKKIVQSDDNIFCYPDVLNTIYSFADFNFQDIERINIINDYKKIYQNCINNNLRINKSESKLKIHTQRFIAKVMATPFQHINSLPKYQCIIWLKTLKLKFSYKSNKSVIQDLVKKYHSDLFN